MRRWEDEDGKRPDPYGRLGWACLLALAVGYIAWQAARALGQLADGGLMP